jgi:RNA polymerase sigma-70 factor (ECF subfamily)
MDTQKKLDPYAEKFIQIKARQLIGKWGIRNDDLDDIKQDFRHDLFRRLPKYNAKKAKLTTFIQRVVEHKIANILRDRRSDKSVANRRCLSLDSTVQTDDSSGREIILGDCVSHDQFQLFCRGKTRSRQEERELVADVRQVVGTLPENLRAACELLLEGMSISETARRVGIKRATFYQNVIEPLREAFREVDLEGYF